MIFRMRNLMATTALTLSLGAGVSIALAGGHEAKEQMDHSQHEMDSMDHSQHDMSGDGMLKHGDHVMTPEMMQELREKIQLYKTYTDQEIALSMQMMGDNYPDYISGPNVKGDTGILLLAHGFGERGDKKLAERLSGLSAIFPTAVSYGMSMMGSGHIQESVDNLVAKGAKRIVVVPVVSTSSNSMMRQWEYIFGARDEAAYLTVPRVESEAEILLTTGLDDNPLVADILLDNLDEMSEDPSKEAVIIVAHGPESEADNLKELQLIQNIADIVKEDGGFAEVTGATLQDDAAPEIRDANVEKLRQKITEAQAAGNKVLIVSNLMSPRSIQHKIRKDLDGLDYKFSNKGVMEHDIFIQWVEESVRFKLEDAT